MPTYREIVDPTKQVPGVEPLTLEAIERAAAYNPIVGHYLTAYRAGECTWIQAMTYAVVGLAEPPPGR